MRPASTRATAALDPRGRNTSRARTLREPGWSTRTRSRGSRGATTTFGFTVKMRAIGRAGRTFASAAPYSDPPVPDGAGVPPAYAAAAGARPTAMAAMAPEIPASTRFRPMPRTVGGRRPSVNRRDANAQLRRAELAAAAGAARRRPGTRASALEHPRHYLECARLFERLVGGAAPWRLDARRAAPPARALRGQAGGGARPGSEAGEGL